MELTASGFPSINEALLAECIHCGLCLETCPTFVETGLEEESPRGRLLLMDGLAAGRWGPESAAIGHLDLCLGCRACETACPSGVQYGRLLEETRAALAPFRPAPRSRLEQFLIRNVLWRGSHLGFVVPLYRKLKLWKLLRALGTLPGLRKDWRRRFKLAPCPETPVPPAETLSRPDAPTAVVLRGCVARALLPASESATVTLLTHAGYAATLLDQPECCGALAAHTGETDLARTFARQLLSRAPETLVIPTAAGCGSHLKGLGSVLEGESDANEATALAARVRDLSEVLLQGPQPLQFERTPSVRVAYLDACHLRHGQGITYEPRRLLEAAGAEIVELPEADLCCGSAGTYNLARPELGERLGSRKANAIRVAGVSTVVTTNPGCAFQLQAELKEEIDVVSLARFLVGRLQAH